MIAKKTGYTLGFGLEPVGSPVNPVVVNPNSDNIAEKPAVAPTVKDDKITGTSPLVIFALFGFLYYATRAK